MSVVVGAVNSIFAAAVTKAAAAVLSAVNAALKRV
jgi:hypothetical protein